MKKIIAAAAALAVLSSSALFASAEDELDIAAEEIFEEDFGEASSSVGEFDAEEMTFPAASEEHSVPSEDFLNIYGRSDSDELGELPDYVGYAKIGAMSYNAETKIETRIYFIGVKGLDEKKRNEILDIVPNNAKAVISDCKRTYSERLAMEQEIRGIKGILSVEAKLENDGILVIYAGSVVDEGAAKRVYEICPEAEIYSETEYMLQADGYNGAQYTAETGEIVPVLGIPTTGVNPVQIVEEPAQNSVIDSPVFWVIAGGVLLMLGGAAFVVIKTRSESSRAKVSNTGSIVSDGKYSRKGVENAVKNAAEQPSDELFGEILKKLEK